MPYLEGESCSIHAIVQGTRRQFSEPVEVITLVRPESGFVYAGTSTWWDPPARNEKRCVPWPGQWPLSWPHVVTIAAPSR